MTKKQFTALVFSICVTIIALIYLGFAIGMAVSMGNTSDNVGDVADEHGGLGALAFAGYLLMSGFIVFMCYLGMLLHSLVGLITAIAAVRTPSRGGKITSIVLIALNGVIIAVAVIPVLISILM